MPPASVGESVTRFRPFSCQSQCWGVLGWERSTAGSQGVRRWGHWLRLPGGVAYHQVAGAARRVRALIQNVSLVDHDSTSITTHKIYQESSKIWIVFKLNIWHWYACMYHSNSELISWCRQCSFYMTWCLFKSHLIPYLLFQLQQ